MKRNKNYSFALCEGKHEIPEAKDGVIFPMTVDPLNIDAMEFMANEKIPEDALIVDIYDTGLAAALIAAINVCHLKKIMVRVWHYDCASGKYYCQRTY